MRRPWAWRFGPHTLKLQYHQTQQLNFLGTPEAKAKMGPRWRQRSLHPYPENGTPSPAATPPPFLVTIDVFHNGQLSPCMCHCFCRRKNKYSTYSTLQLATDIQSLLLGSVCRPWAYSYSVHIHMQLIESRDTTQSLVFFTVQRYKLIPIKNQRKKLFRL